eukprot:79158-Prorocentrum_minimum.AAC.2
MSYHPGWGRVSARFPGVESALVAAGFAAGMALVTYRYWRKPVEEVGRLLRVVITTNKTKTTITTPVTTTGHGKDNHDGREKSKLCAPGLTGARCDRVLKARFKTPSPEEFDYSRTTKDNYTTDTPAWTGLCKEIRETLDHAYHGYYVEDRQRIQDDIIQDCVGGGVPKENPWIVFTAGPMGAGLLLTALLTLALHLYTPTLRSPLLAGKGYVIRWLSRNGLFPLPDLVQIDPDNFKAAFPEWPGYVKAARLTAGSKTRRESGYLVEIAQQVRLSFVMLHYVVLPKVASGESTAQP